jgi:hypothetical protein
VPHGEHAGSCADRGSGVRRTADLRLTGVANYRRSAVVTPTRRLLTLAWSGRLGASWQGGVTSSRFGERHVLVAGRPVLALDYKAALETAVRDLADEPGGHGAELGLDQVV